MPVALVLLGQQLTGVAIAGAIVLATGEPLPSTGTLLLAIAGGLAGAVALGSFYSGLAVGTMSIVAPIAASGVTVPVAVGVATGDRPSAIQAVGIAVCVAGIVLASREVHESDDSRAASRRSIVFALGAAAGFGAYFTLADVVAEESVLWLLLAGRAAAVVAVAPVLVARPPGLRPAPRDVRFLVLVGVLDLLATGLYALATNEGLLSIVAVAASLYPITTVLLARTVLGERLRAEQQAGVALALAGIAAVAAG